MRDAIGHQEADRGAVLDPVRAARRLDHRTFAPSAALAPFVRQHWFVTWSTPAPYTQSILPHPVGNIVVEATGIMASGPVSRRFDRAVEGEGSVYGTNLLPGGLRAFLGGGSPRGPLKSARGFVDERWDLGAERGIAAAPLFQTLDGLPTDADRLGPLAEMLLTLQPRAWDGMEAVNALVAEIAADPQLLRAESIARRAGLSLRTLQRRLRDGVGLGPKALIRRFRLQEAAARLAEGAALNLTDLALGLGYADHAHFTRDFTAVVGVAPSIYRARQLPIA